jgi:hypothetical protein
MCGTCCESFKTQKQLHKNRRVCSARYLLCISPRKHFSDLVIPCALVPEKLFSDLCISVRGLRPLITMRSEARSCSGRAPHSCFLSASLNFCSITSNEKIYDLLLISLETLRNGLEYVDFGCCWKLEM